MTRNGEGLSLTEHFDQQFYIKILLLGSCESHLKQKCCITEIHHSEITYSRHESNIGSLPHAVALLLLSRRHCLELFIETRVQLHRRHKAVFRQHLVGAGRRHTLHADKAVLPHRQLFVLFKIVCARGCLSHGRR